MATTLLPSFFLIQDNSQGPTGPYLCVVKQVDGSSGSLNFTENQTLSPLVKFAAQISETGDRELVHIRSCYNNKYLVVTDAVSPQNLIVASADKPEEDQTNPACTLFRASGSTSSGFQLFSISKSMFVIPGGAAVGLILSQVGQNFAIVDWETLVTLPSQVSFASEYLKDNYMASRLIDGHYDYHRFEPGLDGGDPIVAHQLFPTRDGNYRIKDLHFNKFWKRTADTANSNWILADADEDNDSDDTLFEIKTISNSVVSVRNLGNNNFCGPVTKDGKTNCLCAEYPSVVRRAKLVIKKYQKEIQEVSPAFATNESANQDHEVALSYVDAEKPLY